MFNLSQWIGLEITFASLRLKCPKTTSNNGSYSSEMSKSELWDNNWLGCWLSFRNRKQRKRSQTYVRIITREATNWNDVWTSIEERGTKKNTSFKCVSTDTNGEKNRNCHVRCLLRHAALRLSFPCRIWPLEIAAGLSRFVAVYWGKNHEISVADICDVIPGDYIALFPQLQKNVPTSFFLVIVCLHPR